MPVDARIPMQGENSVDFSPILRGVQQGQQIAATKQNYDLNELKTQLAQLDTAGKLAANVKDVDSLNSALEAGRRFGVLDDKFVNSVPRDENGVRMINSLYQQSEGYKNDLMAQYKAIALSQKEEKNFVGTQDEYNARNQSPSQSDGFDPIKGLDNGENLSATEEAPMADVVVANQPPLKDPKLFMPKKSQFQTVVDGRGVPITKGNMQLVQDEKGNKIFQPFAKADNSTTIDPVSGKVVKTPDLSGTAEKELFKTQDALNAIDTKISALETALELGKNMYSGTGSELLAATSNLPKGVGIPGIDIADKTKATNTIAYNNLLKEMTYETLKSVFPGAISNDERKALIEVQAMSGKSPEAQAKIIKNALKLAKIRREKQADKLKAISSQDYSGFNGEEVNTEPAAPANIDNDKINSLKSKYGL